MNTLLEQNLQQLDFRVDTPESLLLFTNRLYNQREISFGSRLVLEEAKRLSATAVYFRHDRANQAPLPQVFIYDNTNNSIDDSQLAKIHRKIWSSDIVSVYYVIDRTQVRIFDARRPVLYKDKQIFVEPFDTINLVAEAQKTYQKYSAKLFENGAFWEYPEHRNRFLYNNSSSQKLLSELKNFRNQFVAQNQANPDLVSKILMQSILVKYLEERRDEDGRGVFEKNFFAQFSNATDFCDVIRKGEFVALFTTLSAHFNGKIFELTSAETNTLTAIDLSPLANFLDAKLDENQYSFWRLYAFDYVPVELISRIYEEFIPQRKDAVYTPIHLAQFMVDECMPIESPQENYKIIDISCGSGIFLVTAFKRLVQWWQKQQYEKTGALERPSTKMLQSLLRKSIYGVDIEKDAVRLAMFSLSIALCDMLSPTEIWLNLRFDNLEEENLSTDDFFHFLSFAQKNDFDLVIGNPPFKSGSKDVKRILDKYDLDVAVDIPRYEIALLFLQQAMFLLKEKGLLCLVMPAGPLLYNETIEFRRDFLSKYEIPQIIDLSTLREKGYLFESGMSTAVIFARKVTPSPEHNILHITVKRTKASKERHLFEIDQYDLHFVPLAIAISDPIVWKANLLGGGSLYYLLKRMQETRSFGEYLEAQRQHHGWIFGEGFKGDNGDEDAPHIYGKPMVETNQFTENGILSTSVAEGKKFGRSRSEIKEIFQPPHLLLKKLAGVNQFAIKFVDSYLVFRHEIIGIHAPRGFENELENIERFFQSNYRLLKLLLVSYSSRAGISRSLSTLLTKDFMALPFPEDASILALSLNEQAVLNDVINYGIEELSRGERAFVNTNYVDAQRLQEFGETFSRNLNSIYRSENKAFRPLNPIDDVSFICFPFVYGTEDSVKVATPHIRSNLNELLQNERQSVTFQRVLYLYQQDIIYLVKPRLLRYWLKSIALRDATQVMQDLIASGY